MIDEILQRGYKFLNESYMEWENATTKCQSLGARLPVLDTKETIDIVKSYLSKADPEELRALEEWDQSSRRVWLGLNFNSGSGIFEKTFSHLDFHQQWSVCLKLQSRAHMGRWAKGDCISSLQQTFCLGEQAASVSGGELQLNAFTGFHPGQLR